MQTIITAAIAAAIVGAPIIALAILSIRTNRADELHEAERPL
jgi:hypothetical protein